eukprot:2073789-Amphidinium_carterae.1
MDHIEEEALAPDSTSVESIWSKLGERLHLPWASKLVALHLRAAPPILNMMSDECASNRVAFAFLQDTMLQLVFHAKDPLHRQWNDLGLSLKSAGLFGCYLLSIAWLNGLFGPWMARGWFQEYLSQSETALMCMTSEDPLLLSVWCQIMKDIQNDTSFEEVGDEPSGRRLYLEVVGNK